MTRHLYVEVRSTRPRINCLAPCRPFDIDTAARHQQLLRSLGFFNVFLSRCRGCVDASQHFYCAAPDCDTLHAKSSYRLSGLDPLAERGREALRVWRYWERLEAIAPAHFWFRWVTHSLIPPLRSRDVKVQALRRLG